MATQNESWWIKNIGNVSQNLSAIAAVIFGISAAVISYNVANLQMTSASDAARARDNDALVRFGERMLIDSTRYSRSNDCLDVALWYFESDKDRQLQKSLTEKEFYEKFFSRPLQDAALDQKRGRCVTAVPGETASTFFFSLNLLEMALINYEIEMIDLRKRLYHLQLAAIVCKNPGRFRRLFESRDTQVREFLRYGFPKVGLFVQDCETNTAKFPVKA